MFGWLKKKAKSRRNPRSRHIEDFNARMRALEGAGQATRIAVGSCLNLLSIALADTYGNYEDFQAQTYEDKSNYLKKLVALGAKFERDGMHAEAIAADLLAAAITPLLANDTPLFKQLGGTLVAISKEGDLGWFHPK